VTPTSRELTTRRFTFDFPAFAAGAGLSIDLVGTERTITCSIDAATLRLMR